MLEKFVFPRQPGHDRLFIADFFRPADSGEFDVVAFQAVTAGSKVTELMASLEADGEFAEQHPPNRSACRCRVASRSSPSSRPSRSPRTTRRRSTSV